MKRRQILVIGAGHFGMALAHTLFEAGHEVVVVDRDEAKVEGVMNEVTHAAIVDATDEDSLQRLGVGEFDTVVVAVGNDFEAGVLATIAAKSAGAKHVVTKATSELGARVLRRVGADDVVRPDHDMGVRMAHQIATPSLVDAFRLGEDHEVAEIAAEGDLLGSLAELRLPDRFGVQVIAVNREGELEVAPNAEYVLQEGDRVVVIGSVDAVRDLREELSR